MSVHGIPDEDDAALAIGDAGLAIGKDGLGDAYEFALIQAGQGVLRDDSAVESPRVFSPHRRAELFDVDRDVMAEFLAELRSRGHAGTTTRNYDSILRAAAVWMGKPLLESTTFDLRGYLGREGVTNGTRNTNRAVLRAFYGFAVDEGIMIANPMSRIGKSKAVRGHPRPFTPAQVEQLLTSGAYRRTRAMMLLGYYQGLRVSSIARMHGHDINLDAGRIHVVAKGSKERWLPLHPVIAELAKTMPRDGYWFPARGGRDGHITGHSVSDLIRHAILRAGITDPGLTAHSLRHSFGSDLVEQGVDIRVVQELMMHESLTSTQIYTRVSPQLMRDSLMALHGIPLPARSSRGSGRAAESVEEVSVGSHANETPVDAAVDVHAARKQERDPRLSDAEYALVVAHRSEQAALGLDAALAEASAAGTVERRETTYVTDLSTLGADLTTMGVIVGASAHAQGVLSQAKSAAGARNVDYVVIRSGDGWRAISNTQVRAPVVSIEVRR